MILKSAVIATCPAHRRVLDFTLLSILIGLYFRNIRLSMIAIDCITGKSENPARTEQYRTYDTNFPSDVSVIS
jgi:hypothetical protein